MGRHYTDPDSGSDSDEPFSGRPLRHALQANPAKAAPALRPQDLDLLTCSTGRRPAGSGDCLPPVLRPGSEQALQLPSRRGAHLYHPDGRVTDLTGHPVDAPTVQRCSLPLSVSNASRWSRVNGRE